MKTHDTMIPAVVPPPGDTIRAELEARGWSQRKFAALIHRPVQAVNEVIRGRRQITAEMALALAEAFSTSAELWMGLEGRYRLHLARQHRRRTASA